MFKRFGKLQVLAGITTLLLAAAAFSAFEITNKGYIKVYAPDGSLVSQHTQVKEAYEAISADAESKGLEGQQDYSITFPNQVMSLFLPSAQAATVVDDNLTGQICSDGLIYVGGCPGGEDPVEVTGYFVDSVNGNDSANSGLTSDQPWRTLAKVEQMLGPSNVGVDVWLKAGSVFEDQRLVVDWSGTASNRAIVGCYYLSGGVAFRCTSAQTKPEINGTFENADRVAMRGVIPWPQDYTTSPYQPYAGTYVPSGGFYTGLVAISDANDQTSSFKHITIENLKLVDSVGGGVRVGDWAYDVIVRNNEVGYTLAHAINIGDNAWNTFVSANHVHHAVYCAMYFQGISSNTTLGLPFGCVNDYPATISGGRQPNSTAPGAYTIIHNNDIRWSWGEGVGSFRTNNTIIIGNRIRNTRRNPIYVTNGNNRVVESNIIWTNNSTDQDFDQSHRSNNAGIAPFNSSGGIAVFIENNSGRRPTTNVLIRNNIVQGSSFCFDHNTNSDGDPIGAKVLNNLCIDIQGSSNQDAIRVGKSAYDTATNYPQAVYENNIIYAPALAAGGICEAVTNTVEKSFRNNFWSTTPSDTDCRSPGTGDLQGKPAFARDADTWGKSNWTSDVGPTFADAVLQSGAAINGGTGQQLSVQDSSPFDNFGLISYPFVPSAALWELEAAYDAIGTVRDATQPDMGPMESN